MGIATTDNTEIKDCGQTAPHIVEHFLPSNEYFAGPTPKQWIFLHHTAGWHNPGNVIDNWAADSRGAIATEFIIGGQSIRNNDNTHDGQIMQAFPTGGYAWHLGIGNSEMHRNAVGIEVCSFGQLTADGYYRTLSGQQIWQPMKKGKFYTYVGTEVHPEQVVKLAKPFRTFQYWQRYSNQQIEALARLILHIANRDNIDVRKGLPQLVRKQGAKAFDTCNPELAKQTPGLWCHANLTTAKLDMFPQEELVEMLRGV